MPWDPEQYERFRREREQPFHDLLARVRPVDSPRILDLGCGTGRLTRHLHDHLGASSTLGIDASHEMLSQSTRYVCVGLDFEHGDVADPILEPRDLVFSNAALHWLPDHPTLLARVAQWVVPGGQLAVQVPANHEQAAHRLADGLAEEEPFASALGRWRRVHSVVTPIAYDRILRDLGFDERSVALQIYGHELPNLDAVVEWGRGSFLTPYRDRLPPALFERFVQAWRRRMHQRLGDARPFYYPYRRILMWGRKSG